MRENIKRNPFTVAYSEIKLDLDVPCKNIDSAI